MKMKGNVVMNKLFPNFDVDYLNGVMSLRKPQKTSLKRLADILEEIEPSKNIDLNDALAKVHNLFPTCSNFEREFISLTFALATGVGKTRLMGAFITYLYCNYGYKNFFVVAPNLTIYEKLKSDLGNPADPKYVFKGCGCFSKPPQVYSDTDYQQKHLDFSDSNINIFVFNISKFNSEKNKMKAMNEYLGESFFDTLANLNDLVLLMDESHHYRAKQGWKALNDLKPILGLELTATPVVTSGSKQKKFKNVVYEYPLSMSIKDGYTRTPYAVTRTDVDCYNFGEEELDKLMIKDGIWCHEKTKRELKLYANNNNKAKVKPFMLIVCKDTEHANWVLDFIKSYEFEGGKYINKVITIHSNLKGDEKDENIKHLLEVENPDNPIEIVIHVNILKEGWDVNNLYTIVPLRTATSKVLREQTVGRGLRLPYGERVGEKYIDAVMLTAHDKFNEILEEAQSGESIFNAGNVINIDEERTENITITQPKLIDDDCINEAYNATGLDRNENNTKIFKAIRTKNYAHSVKNLQNTNHNFTIEQIEAEIANETILELKKSQDYSETYHQNQDVFYSWAINDAKKTYQQTQNNQIPIPRIEVTDSSNVEYAFQDFEIDLTEFNEVPIENDILIQNLDNIADSERKNIGSINSNCNDPIIDILTELKNHNEINYERDSELMLKLISAVVKHYIKKFDKVSSRNIVMMSKKNIAEKIYIQMMKHFVCLSDGLIQEEVVDVSKVNIRQQYNYSHQQPLFDRFDSSDKKITSVLFTEIKKGVFIQAKFDSAAELEFAKILEHGKEVEKWLRPAQNQFNIFYDRNKRYVPDFVVEASDAIYMVEVKGENMLDDPDVIAKKERAKEYCKIATEWNLANEYKEWKYLFIPSQQIQPSYSFSRLANQFVVI